MGEQVTLIITARFIRARIIAIFVVNLDVTCTRAFTPKCTRGTEMKCERVMRKSRPERFLKPHESGNRARRELRL